MEALKFSWALNVAKLPTTVKANGLIRAFVKPGGKTPYTFEELMNMLAQHLCLSHQYTFIEDRNALFHTGRGAADQTLASTPDKAYEVLFAELSRVHDQLDDVLLSILKYNGPLWPYWEMRAPVGFPGRKPYV